MASRKKTEAAKRPERLGAGDPVLATYLGDIADSTPLSSGEEAQLARRIRAGEEGARNALVEANLRFVVSVAKEYQNRGLSLVELISAGNIGLIVAAERFDEGKGFKFISYAVWWIRQSILQALMDQSTVRVPVNRLDLLAKITRTFEELQQEGVAPTMARVARVLGFSEREIEDTLANGQAIRSLDAPFDDAEERCLLDSLCDENQPSPEEDFLRYTLQEDVDAALRGLSGREAEVLRLYFGIGQDRPLTLDQIGTRFKLTRERVRQIKEIALNKLRHPKLYARLRSYSEN
jgi:RNA polymerase primary sigma factor